LDAIRLAERSIDGELGEETDAFRILVEPFSGPRLYTKLLLALPVADACDTEPDHPGV
jgi:hypothetical protein